MPKISVLKPTAMGQDPLKSYTSYALSVKRLLLFNGMWPLQEPNIFYKLLPYTTGLVFFIIGCATMNFAFVHILNLSLAMKGMGLSLGHINVIAKVIPYVVYRQDIRELDDTLNELLEKQKNNEQLLSRALSSFKFFKILSQLLMGTAFSVVALYFLTPLIHIISQYRHDITPIRYLLPYPTIYPYIVPGGSFLYIIHFIFESYGCLCLFCVTAGVDNLFALFASQIIGQIRVLTYEMKYFSFREDYRKELDELIIRHQTLIRCCKRLQKINGPIVLSMLLTTAIILCSLIFQISQMKTISIKQIMFFAVYIGLKLSQTLIYAWAGSLITVECDNFRTEVYNSGWENLGHKSVRHYVSLILMQKPIYLKACSYITMSINLFTGILNTALSYFFLLQTLEEKV